jgi:hypothetical protein
VRQIAQPQRSIKTTKFSKTSAICFKITLENMLTHCHIDADMLKPRCRGTYRAGGDCGLGNLSDSIEELAKPRQNQNISGQCWHVICLEFCDRNTSMIFERTFERTFTNSLGRLQVQNEMR